MNLSRRYDRQAGDDRHHEPAAATEIGAGEEDRAATQQSAHARLEPTTVLEGESQRTPGMRAAMQIHEDGGDGTGIAHGARRRRVGLAFRVIAPRFHDARGEAPWQGQAQPAEQLQQERVASPQVCALMGQHDSPLTRAELAPPRTVHDDARSGEGERERIPNGSGNPGKYTPATVERKAHACSPNEVRQVPRKANDEHHEWQESERNQRE